MRRLHDNARGALLMIGCMASYTFGDAVLKVIGSSIPLSQLLVLRGLLASVLIGVVAWQAGFLRARLSGTDLKITFLRSAAEAGAAYFFLTALRGMPLADLSALLQMLPLTVTLGAVLIFGLKVGWRRWLAIALGFCGMVLIVNPSGDGIDLWALYGLGAVACVTFRDLATSRLSQQAPTLLVTLVSSVFVVCMAGVWSVGQSLAGQTWVAITPEIGGLIAVAAVLVFSGYSLSVAAMRVGDVSVVAPFRYSSLVIAMILGVLVFGERPSAQTLIGAALIVATGLYSFWRETRNPGPKTG